MEGVVGMEAGKGDDALSDIGSSDKENAELDALEG